jgi:hypothetical protein
VDVHDLPIFGMLIERTLPREIPGTLGLAATTSTVRVGRLPAGLGVPVPAAASGRHARARR